jgi:hypothetical protein
VVGKLLGFASRQKDKERADKERADKERADKERGIPVAPPAVTRQLSVEQGE